MTMLFTAALVTACVYANREDGKGAMCVAALVATSCSVTLAVILGG